MSTLELNCTALPSLPEEVILEILSRLPAKYVVRFSCVCKRWLLLTSDSQFIKLHITRSIQNNHLNLILVCFPRHMRSLRMPTPTCIYCLQDKSFDEDLQIEQAPCGLFRFRSIAGSCNGLVCLVRGNDALLLNPITREYKLVEIDNELERGVVKRGFHIYRPHNGDAEYGLVYDSINDDYKLVQFIYFSFGSPGDSKLNIYSLNDSSCVTISHVPYSVVNYGEWGVYLNGALHWVATSKSQNENVIVSFDVMHKVIQEFPLPDVEDKNSHATLGVLRGQLCIFRKTYFEIWVMRIYGVGSSWYKLASMDKDYFIAELQPYAFETVLSGARVLCFSDGGGILLMFAKQLFLYDPEQKTCKRIEIHGKAASLQIITVTTLVASYVSLKSGTYLRQQHYF